MAERVGVENAGKVSSNGEMLAYVQRIARKIRTRFGKQVSEEDLIAYGVVGYLEASARFRDGMGVSLHQYVYLRTYGAMIDGVRRWSLQRHLWATKRRADLRSKRDSSKGDSETGACRSVISMTSTPPLNSVQPLGGGLGESREPFCAGPLGGQWNQGNSIEEIVDIRRRWGQFLRAARVLDRKERAMLTLYYVDGYSMSEVATRLGCTKSWICRMHRRALKKLRDQLDVKQRSQAGKGVKSRCETRQTGMSAQLKRRSQPSSPLVSSSSASSPSSGPQARQDGKN